MIQKLRQIVALIIWDILTDIFDYWENNADRQKHMETMLIGPQEESKQGFQQGKAKKV